MNSVHYMLAVLAGLPSQNPVTSGEIVLMISVLSHDARL